MIRHIIAPLAIALSVSLPSQGSGPFSFENDQAPKDVIIPGVVPAIFGLYAPGDAPFILRTTTLLNNVWFDSIAPYSDTSVGICSTIARRPVSERNDTNRNIAIFYASLRILDSLYPTHKDDWRQLLQNVGLDPCNTTTDLSTPIGIGNAAGLAVVAVREQDGMNQLGDRTRPNLRERYDVGRPYFDYTGYKPKNTAYDLRDAGRWQPAIIDNGYGIFRVQQFVTPQYAKVTPYSFANPNSFRAPRPRASNPRRMVLYKQQVDDVLNASANMTDRQKMIAELFEDKIQSLGFSALFISVSQNMSLESFVQYDFLTNLAAFDTGIAIWQEKRRYDAVRPFSAIRYIYGNNTVTAWGGPGKGTVNDLPASQWRSYLPVADHPEYPSASAAFCAAHAQSSRLFLGSDNLGWSIPVDQGSSVIEPGHTPQTNITIGWNTWTEFEAECGMSRFWAGVHFPAAVPAGQTIGREIGTKAYQYLMGYIQGNPL
jgi:hypothetical protein